MKIAIVGAGFSGLSCARVLRRLGHEVTVHEMAPDVGGVWSATRRYPGLETQNNKGSYALSEMRMPKEYPEWPSGEQVQRYLVEYADSFDITPHVRVNTEVVAAEPAASGGWDITLRSPTGRAGDHVDHLVVANGIYSRPHVPEWEGRHTFEACGGMVISASDLHTLDAVRGKHVIVVGYGKSACDIAVAVSSEAESITVIARNLMWKVPRRLLNVLNNKYVLTRFGESLFRYRKLRGLEKVMHYRKSPPAKWISAGMAEMITRQCHLDVLGLRPPGTFVDIGRASFSVVTEGFFEGVANGTIGIRKGTRITDLMEVGGRPHVRLSDGTTLPADIVIAATGWRQEVPFLPREVLDTFTTESGEFLLHRQIHPIGVPDLSFCGYNSSQLSALSAEAAAWWIGSHLAGQHRVPSDREMLIERLHVLEWMRERTHDRHAHGTAVVPFSIHNIDETLDDIGLNLSRPRRVKQWLLPFDPSDYNRVLDTLAARIGSGTTGPGPLRSDRPARAGKPLRRLKELVTRS